MNSEDPSQFKCSDFNLSCVLKYFGCELLEIKRDRDKKVWCFKRSDRLDQILQNYWKGNVIGNLVDFLAVQDFVRSSIYNQ